MNILVTGAKGFIGKNLITHLQLAGSHNIYEYDIDTDEDKLDDYTRDCEFVFHLAGINRPKNEDEFMEGNYGFTSVLLNSLKSHNNKSPIVITSSIQARLDNPYGISKKAAEDLMFDYGREAGVKVLVYRLPNVFGKWCKPNYNSAVATFCHNIANGLDIKVNDPNVIMNLVYIDDVIEEFLNALTGRENIQNDYCYVDKTYTISLGRIAELIYSFKNSRIDLSIPDMSNEFEKKLYSTYLSYLPVDQFSYPLRMNIDERGSFTEILRTIDRGQVSVNITKPGITKGNHWHHTKNEKFLVVQGKGLIRFRKVDCSEIIEYYVSGDKLEVVDIPVGYTHSIKNIGDNDLVTIMWANEVFNPGIPDTYYLEV
jgi:UDP-2-acetamido-2,6-beta-L-arabino-hexul-4-ose reductase